MTVLCGAIALGIVLTQTAGYGADDKPTVPTVSDQGTLKPTAPRQVEQNQEANQKEFCRDMYEMSPAESSYRQIFGPPVTWLPPVTPSPVVTTWYYPPPVYVNSFPPPPVYGPVIVRPVWRPFLRTFIP